MNIFFTIDSLTSKMAILHTDSNFLFFKNPTFIETIRTRGINANVFV